MVTLENVLDIFDFQGPKVRALVQATLDEEEPRSSGPGFARIVEVAKANLDPSRHEGIEAIVRRQLHW